MRGLAQAIIDLLVYVRYFQTFRFENWWWMKKAQVLKSGEVTSHSNLTAMPNSLKKLFMNSQLRKQPYNTEVRCISLTL